ncbi:MAG: hypothetical protein Q8R28_21430 [Dehalococcoidia bacterium]|nr:hypothetical protein [Dehalococcoidia bacterium]
MTSPLGQESFLRLEVAGMKAQGLLEEMTSSAKNLPGNAEPQLGTA